MTTHIAPFGGLLNQWRRTRHLSQTQLSLQAEVSQRHLSFLESGRAQPSREMVVHLANVLDVPLSERNQLLTAAGFAPAYKRRRWEEDDMGAVRDAVQVLLSAHEPFPALAVDLHWNLLWSNEAAVRFFGFFVDQGLMWSQVGGDAPNVLRATLHPRGLRPFILNFPELAGGLLQRLRRESWEIHGDAGNLALYREMKQLAGEVGHADRGLFSSPCLTMDLDLNGRVLKMLTVVSTIGTPQDLNVQEVRVETFFPADDATRQFITEAAGR